MANLILITGGARSGKSDYAQNRAEALPGKHFFLATCPVVDQEMDDRIRRHQQGRQDGKWQTIEEEINIASILDGLPSASVCLVDCLTLWVNNLMYQAENMAEKFDEPFDLVGITTMTPLAPSRTNALMIARPIPEAAPVTMAT